MMGRILFAVLLLALIAGVAGSQAFYSNKSAKTVLWENQMDFNAAPASYGTGTTGCIEWWGESHYEGEVGRDCSSSHALLPVAMKKHITDLCWTKKETYGGSNGGCDFRLSADRGSTALHSNSLIVPPTNASEMSIGETACVTVGAVVEPGDLLVIQNKNGTNGTTGSGGTCDGLHGFQSISILGFEVN